MNCTYHIRNQISCICLAPHKCLFQRKLCAQCLQEHEIDVKHAVPINIFKKMVLNKLKEYKLDETSELNKQRMNLKSMLSQTESMLKKIWEKLQESIKQIYDIIEMQNKLYSNIINENTNIFESSYTYLEKLIKILEGTTLKNWNDQRNSYLIKLQKVSDWWGKEIKVFNEKMKKQIKDIMQSNKNQPVQKQEQQQCFESITILNSLTFSEKYKYPSCQVSENGKLFYNQSLFFSCLCDQVIPTQGIVRFGYLIHDVINNQTMVGIGAREMISKCGYINIQDSGKGAYLIMSSGYCFSHDQQEKYHNQIPFTFTKNDIIIIEVEIKIKYVKWIKKSTNQSFLLDIDPNYEYYPCINGPGKVEILTVLS
ncbi:unnamed protein product [Paramecium pentaurelia]|uniref:Uncharacterized protein n=1 Tax=Paramecium pentaurelia TaxID=43138 RepID=A0A8S1WUH5_9CILI|nr:unnamed protein product [Paramecium pentaurelia]